MPRIVPTAMSRSVGETRTSLAGSICSLPVSATASSRRSEMSSLRLLDLLAGRAGDDARLQQRDDGRRGPRRRARDPGPVEWPGASPDHHGVAMM